MRYFVIGDDGQKYGPADLATLNSWITEGRLLPTQQLEDEASGMRLAAGAVQGLNFPVQSAAAQAVATQPGPTAGPYAGAQPYQQGYPRAGYGDDGSEDVKKAWIYAIIGFFCCIFLQIPALIFAGKAASKGNTKATAPKIFSIVVIVLQILYMGFSVMNVINHPPVSPMITR